MTTIKIRDNDINTIAEHFGKKAVHTTWDGERITGTLARPTDSHHIGSGYPIIEFPDGGWARCTDTIELA